MILTQYNNDIRKRFRSRSELPIWELWKWSELLFTGTADFYFLDQDSNLDLDLDLVSRLVEDISKYTVPSRPRSRSWYSSSSEAHS